MYCIYVYFTPFFYIVLFSRDSVSGGMEATEGKFTHACIIAWTPNSGIRSLEFVADPNCGKKGIVLIDTVVREGFIARDDGWFECNDRINGVMLGNLAQGQGMSGLFDMSFDQLCKEGSKWNGRLFNVASRKGSNCLRFCKAVLDGEDSNDDGEDDVNETAIVNVQHQVAPIQTSGDATIVSSTISLWIRDDGNLACTCGEIRCQHELKKYDTVLYILN